MASIHGFMDGSLDYRHMYNIKDIRGPFPHTTFNKHTIMDFLNVQNYNDMKDLIILAGLCSVFNDTQMKGTLFVPMTTSKCPIDTLDRQDALKVVHRHTLPFQLKPEVLKSSVMMTLLTKDNDHTIISETINNETIINHSIPIKGYIVIGHVIVYLIDRFI